VSRGHFLDKRNEQLSATEPAAGRSHDKKKTSAASHSYAKKHSGGDDHGGGGGGHESDDTLWLYSFNDMLFNLLLFFIVMYSISQVDEKKFAEVQEALQGDKRPALVKDDEDKDGVVVGPRNGAMDAKQLGSSGGEAGGDKSAAISEAVRFMLERAEKGKVKLAKGTGKDEKKEKLEATKKSKYLSGTNIPLPMQLAFTADEFFAQDSANLTARGERNLKQLGTEVARQEKLGRVEVEVHTNFTPETINSPKALSSFTDLKLSTVRAGVIFEYFLKAGVPHKSVVSAGYADGRPIVSLESLTPKQRQEFSESNERIVVTLKKEKAP
jgi:chemotaxis protein MotB